MNRKLAIGLAVGGGAIIVVGLATYFGVKLATKPENQEGGGSDENGGGTRPPSEDESVPQTGTQQGKMSFPLSIGDRGVGVAYLQKSLQCLGKYSGGIDGKFGIETYKAIRSYFTFQWFNCTFHYECKLSEKQWKEIVQQARQKCGLATFSLPDSIWEEYTQAHTDFWNKKRQEK
jgi:hypothetical protein